MRLESTDQALIDEFAVSTIESKKCLMAAVSCQNKLSLQALCKMWLKVWFKHIQWNCASLECRVEPTVQFSKISELWTELWQH